MKPIISQNYATLNRQLHDEKPEYGVAAAQDAGTIIKLAHTSGYSVILDFGCGKGALKPAVAKLAPHLTILEFDPAIPGKDALPQQPVHLVAALDVMEHIEPEFLNAVFETICALKPHGVLMKIALTPAQKTLPDGRNAHLIVEPPSWWEERLKVYFKAFSTQTTPLHYIFYGTPIA